MAHRRGVLLLAVAVVFSLFGGPAQAQLQGADIETAFDLGSEQAHARQSSSSGASRAGRAPSCVGGTIRTCLKASLSTNVFFQGDAGYEGVAYSWQLRNPGKAYAVAVPTTASQIAGVFNCAQTCDVGAGGKPLYRVTARSGGHSFEGYSAGAAGFDPTKRVIVVDLKNMRVVSVQPTSATTAIAQIGAGWKLGPVYWALYNAKGGPWLLAGGTCPGVGVGQALAGGVGDFGRLFGVLSNSVVEMEIVVPDGRTLRLNAKSKGALGDLFWALRGGGQSNFGIVTRFWFHVQKVPDTTKVTFFSLKWNGSLWAKFATAYYALANGKDFPAEVTAELNVSPSNPAWGDGDPSVIFLQGLWFNNANASRIFNLFKPVLDAVGNPNEQDIRVGRYIDTILWNSWLEAPGRAPTVADLSLTTGAYPTDGHYWKAGSLVIPAAPKPNGPFVKALWETVMTKQAVDGIPWNNGIADVFTLQVLWGGQRSYLTNPQNSPYKHLSKPVPSAYPYQFANNTFSSFEIQVVWNNGKCERCLSWLRAAYQKIVAGWVAEFLPTFKSVKAYYNYLDHDNLPFANGTLSPGPNAPGAMWQGELYWGDSTWKRLQAIKKIWDPKGVMTFSRGVPLT